MSAFESIGLIILMAYFAAAVIFPIFWTVVTLMSGLKNGRFLGLLGAWIPPVLMGILFSGFLDVIFNIFFIYSYRFLYTYCIQTWKMRAAMGFLIALVGSALYYTHQVEGLYLRFA